MSKQTAAVLVAGFLCALAACSSEPPEQSSASAEPPGYWVYIGDYTADTSRGVYRARFNPDDGSLGEPELAAEIENPSFLTLHPNGNFLYAVTETDDGSVSAFSIDKSSGDLTLLNTVPTDGSLPCDLEVDRSGKMLVVVNYGSGSVAAYQIRDDGSLSAISDFDQHQGSSVHERQKGPHAHSIDFTSDNRFAIVSDLGMDRLFVYQVDPDAGRLKPAATPTVSLAPATGPRHFAFHPSERFGYSLGEIASTVTAMRFDAATGELTPIETVSTLPEDFSGQNAAAEIEVDAAGNFLYASNRGHDSIAVFSIDQQTGELTRTAIVPSGGERPRNFAIAPGGKFLLAANQNTDNVVVFSVDPATGGLTPTGREIAVDAPVCVKYLAAE